jgi:hypothetical protein
MSLYVGILLEGVAAEDPVLPEHPEIALAGDRGARWDWLRYILWV